MTNNPNVENINRGSGMSLGSNLIRAGLSLIKKVVFKPNDWEGFSYAFGDLYSNLSDFAEHSISHHGFTLPTALGDQPVQNVNRLLSKLYGGQFANISLCGSSGALLTLLTAVLPKLHPDRDLILFDDMCHQSAIGGLIFGRWEAVRLSRSLTPESKTARPLSFETIKNTIETHGPDRISAILLVTPCYDGFSTPSEMKKIYRLAKSLEITVIIDGAWDSVRFRQPSSLAPALSSLCDVWITSPHKRGLTPSSLGCMITNSETIAALWDEALDLGFRSSSISFVDIMIAEHRLQQVIRGDWDVAFSEAEKSAQSLRAYIPSLHPSLEVISPRDVGAETTDPAHILISTHLLPDFDARNWAQILSSQFALDVEKATASTLLLLCASPAHYHQLNEIKKILKKSFMITFERSGVVNVQ
jgi:arginine/lysine/ornithine decarboxylase